MQYLFAAVLLVHGLIHLLGFAQAVGWTLPLQQSLGASTGVLWLGTAVLFLSTSVLVAIGHPLWWLPALPALVASQSLIVSAWSLAKFGTIPNVILLLPLVVTLLDYRGSSFRSSYEREVSRRLPAAAPVGDPARVISPDDLRHLPPAVRRYVESAGSVGRSEVRNFRVTMRGRIRRSTTSEWMTFEAVQHNFLGDRTRLFLLRAWQLGIPFEAYHRFAASTATMQVKVLSLLPVVDARGPEMNQSETVTLFNDMCFLAPATLIDRDISWREVAPRVVQATFNNAGVRISAVLTFDESGDLRNFESDDRYLSADGKKYERYHWSTPMRDYRDFDGRRIATRGEASWRLSDGDFTYVDIEITSAAYNVAQGGVAR